MLTLDKSQFNRNDSSRKSVHYQNLTKAIGTSNFCKMASKSLVIVDKTMLIRDVMDSPYDIDVACRPRRWGKSLNSDMLMYFLSNG
jgi:hypothetical protein